MWAVIEHCHQEWLSWVSDISCCWHGSHSIVITFMCTAQWCLNQWFRFLKVWHFSVLTYSAFLTWINCSDLSNSWHWRFHLCRSWAMQKWWISDDQTQNDEDLHCESTLKCLARCFVRWNAVTIQLTVAAELDWGTRSRERQGMIEYQKRQAFKKESLRQRLKTWISFLSSIVECVIQSMHHDSLSSKIQAAAADMFNWIWTSERCSEN